MRRDLRIVLVGDAAVGKSTLISSLVKDTYVPHVAPVLPPVSLPLEASPEGVNTTISDTPSSPERRPQLEAELRHAHVICLVYAVDTPSSFERLGTFWLPYLRSIGVNVPVVLVGNKIDVRAADAPEDALEHDLAPLMADFKEVESCVECSAKLHINVSEIFYFAHKAVLYPTAPLYDSRHHTLKPAATAALKRIFHLCDLDKDNLLNDTELNLFQRRCFGTALQPQELAGTKDVITFGARSNGWSPSSAPYPQSSSIPFSGTAASETPASYTADTGSSSWEAGASLHSPSASVSASASAWESDNPHVRDGSVTLVGFLYLNTLFIRRGRLETTWTILRAFGYGSDLDLEEKFVRPAFPVEPATSVELSPHGYQFLTDIFEAYDADRDGALSDKELSALFSLAPGGRHPWHGTGFPRETTTTNDLGHVTLQGWLAQWSMTTLLDHRVTLAYMAYLGYPSFTALTGGGKENFLNSAEFGSSSSDSHYTFPSSTTGASGRGGNLSPAQGEWPDTTTALQRTHPRRTDRKKKGRVQRNVFLAYVVGGPESGKTTLLRSLLGHRWTPTYQPTHRPICAVSAVEYKGAEKYLVLQELPPLPTEQDLTLRSPARLAAADVMVFVYDSSDTTSFSHVANLRHQFGVSSSAYTTSSHPGYLFAHIPCLVVATKADLDLAVQRHAVQPDVYCRQKLALNIPGLGAGPLHVSAKDDRLADLFGHIVSIAIDARGAIAGGRRAESALTGLTRRRWWVYVLTVLAGSGAVLFLAKRWGIFSFSWPMTTDSPARPSLAASGGMRSSASPGQSWLPFTGGAAGARSDL